MYTVYRSRDYYYLAVHFGRWLISVRGKKPKGAYNLSLNCSYENKKVGGEIKFENCPPADTYLKDHLRTDPTLCIFCEAACFPHPVFKIYLWCDVLKVAIFYGVSSRYLKEYSEMFKEKATCHLHRKSTNELEGRGSPPAHWPLVRISPKLVFLNQSMKTTFSFFLRS
jgi:hypothetical protein